jgi:solute carrier family 35 protein
MTFQRKAAAASDPYLSVPAMTPRVAPIKYSTATKVTAALYYGASPRPLAPTHSSPAVPGERLVALASAIIMVANKIVLYVWGFPSPAILALAQFAFSVLALRVLRRAGAISFPDTTFDVRGTAPPPPCRRAPRCCGMASAVANPARAHAQPKTLRRVFPLPVLFMGNAISGLAGTGALSIPMFTVLRRTNMLLTMLLEYYLLQYRFSALVCAAVAVMMLGSAVAAWGDLGFDLHGYSLVMVNNVLTSFMGVVTRMKLDASHQDPDTKSALGMFGLMYNNSLVAAPLLAAYLAVAEPHTIRACIEFEHWADPVFCVMFVLSSAMGTLLQLSIFYCTQVNSALATVVTGVLKNVVTSYVGMVSTQLGYTFSPLNFVGINLSMFGGICYAYQTFRENQAALAPGVAAAALPAQVADARKEEVGGDLNDHDEESNKMLKR